MGGASSLVVQLLGAGTFATVLSGIITAIVNRRKLSADATKVITDAAATTVSNLLSDNAALREENRKANEKSDRALNEVASLREKMERREAEWMQYREAEQAVLQVHAAFDSLMVERLRACRDEGHMDDAPLPDPPPLYPPTPLRPAPGGTP